MKYLPKNFYTYCQVCRNELIVTEQYDAQDIFSDWKYKIKVGHKELCTERKKLNNF